MPPRKKNKNPKGKEDKMEGKEEEKEDKMEEQIKKHREEWCVNIDTHSTHDGEESSSMVRAPKYLQTNYEATKSFFVPQEVSLGPIHFLKKNEYHSAEIYKSYAARLVMKEHGSKKLFDPLSKFELSEGLDLLKQNKFILAVNDEIEKCIDPGVRSMQEKCIYFIMFRDTCFLLVCLQEWEKDKKLPNYFHEDIMKMENQIPFSLLKSLHEDRNCICQSNTLEGRFSSFASDLLSYPLVEKESCRYSVPTFNNLLDCMHQLVLGKVHVSLSGTNGRSEPVPPAIATEVRQDGTESSCVQLPSATKLRNAGIHFKSLTRGEGIQQIVFEAKTSTLCLPKVFFGDFTDVIWRNLIAYEIKQKKDAERGVIRFVHLMKDLVCNSGDTDLLSKSGVLESRREDEKVTKFWSKLGGKTTRNPFAPIEEVVTAVKKVYDKRRSRILWNEFLALYCSKPWVLISASAATFLLLMTVVQVVCLFCKCNRYG